MRLFPAIECVASRELHDDELDFLIAAIDDARPTGVDARENGARVFFDSAQARDRALDLLAGRPLPFRWTALDVPDDGWAERSQASLDPVRVGRVIVSPPWRSGAGTESRSGPDAGPDDIVVLIQPSMGFGTGHHASTRLCLDLLQKTDLDGARVLDVGTGSGVLAVAAWRLGAARVTAIEPDREALASALVNLELNGAADAVALVPIDLESAAADESRPFDVVVANLTGAQIAAEAAALAALTAPRGWLILSGVLAEELLSVEEALARQGCRIADSVIEDGWVAVVTTPTASTAS
jgi:ribosomal protein L11 methyltransferase